MSDKNGGMTPEEFIASITEELKEAKKQLLESQKKVMEVVDKAKLMIAEGGEKQGQTLAAVIFEILGGSVPKPVIQQMVGYGKPSYGMGLAKPKKVMLDENGDPIPATVQVATGCWPEFNTTPPMFEGASPDPDAFFVAIKADGEGLLHMQAKKAGWKQYNKALIPVDPTVVTKIHMTMQSADGKFTKTTSFYGSSTKYLLGMKSGKDSVVIATEVGNVEIQVPEELFYEEKTEKGYVVVGQKIGNGEYTPMVNQPMTPEEVIATKKATSLHMTKVLQNMLGPDSGEEGDGQEDVVDDYYGEEDETSN